MPEIPRYLPIKVAGPKEQMGKSDPVRNCGGTTWKKSIPKEGMTDLKSKPDEGFSCPVFSGAIVRFTDGKEGYQAKLGCKLGTDETSKKISEIIDEIPSMCPFKLAIVENLPKTNS